VQQARNLALDLGERFTGVRVLIRDRGSNCTRSLDAVFQAAGTTILRTQVRAPRMHAICECLAGTLHREIRDPTVILNQARLRAVLAAYQEHYNTARPIRVSASASLTPNATLPASPLQISARVRSVETCPERPDQRIRAGRLKAERASGQNQNPNFGRYRHQRQAARRRRRAMLHRRRARRAPPGCRHPGTPASRAEAPDASGAASSSGRWLKAPARTG
jgi:hypothetical protein